MKKVGIVMPCINLWDKYTKPAFETVAPAMGKAIGFTGFEMHFLLIDNGSTDATRTEGQKINSGISNVCTFAYHRNEEMWGFQKSVNFGVKYFFDKGFDYVLVLNNDIALHPNAIWRLVERFEKGGVSMVTCMDVTLECDKNPANLSKIDDELKAENCPETPHPCFSAFMVNRECWDVVGEFDEIFAPAYYEDNDYHYRMQLAGLLAITYPPAMFFHWASRTQLEALGRPLTDSTNQHAQYVRKWGGDPAKEVFKTAYNDPRNSWKFTAQAPDFRAEQELEANAQVHV